MPYCPTSPSYIYQDNFFRTNFPAFSDVTTFPTTTLQMYWNQAGTIIQNSNYGDLANSGGPFALNLMTAHLTALSVLIANGENPAVTVGAGIDKINVTLMPPPYKSQFAYWLGTTPYGQQLLAMLKVSSVGGFYTPGSLGRAGFNFSGANGRFGWWGW